MTIEELTSQLEQQAVDFKHVMQVIDDNYTFEPTTFKNGSQINEAGTNNGSCKIFAFGKLNNLSKQATLNAFGDFYTVDVLQHPNADDHQNIRNFIDLGWDGIEFSGTALLAK